MAEDLAVTFRRPFAEQVAAWRLRLGNLVPTSRWDDLWKGQHDRAFMVAGATKADLLADLATAVDKAIVGGTSLEEFRRDFRKIVEDRGWHGWAGEGTSAGEAWRTRVIYRTNMRTSYMAGRHAQLVAGNFKFWIYRHGGSAEPRVQHLGWDGLILPPDHPFWATHFPPNGWGCSCYVIGARSMRSAIRRGGKPDLNLPDGWNALTEKTGEPDGIDKGWGYAPGSSVVQDIARLVEQKAATLPSKVAANLTASAESIPPAPPLPMREAKSLKDARRLVQELSLSEVEVGWPSGSDLDGVNIAIRAIVEIESRFDLTPMQAFGSGYQIARLSRSLKHMPKAYAWFGMRANVMGFNKGGLATRQTRIPEEWRARHRAKQAQKVALMADGPAKRAAQGVDFDHAVFPLDIGRDLPRFVTYHESGHRFHANFWAEVNEAIEGWSRDGWNWAISSYGSTNPREFVAESFALYMRGEEFHHRIKPELLTLFRSKDKLR